MGLGNIVHEISDLINLRNFSNSEKLRNPRKEKDVRKYKDPTGGTRQIWKGVRGVGET